MKNYDVVVIGGGPGGYAAGIRAAQLGGSVCVSEIDRSNIFATRWIVSRSAGVNVSTSTRAGPKTCS